MSKRSAHRQSKNKHLSHTFASRLNWTQDHHEPARREDLPARDGQRCRDSQKSSRAARLGVLLGMGKSDAHTVCQRPSSRDRRRQFCPYVQRAWITLEERGIPYQYKEVNPYKKENHFLGTLHVLVRLVPIVQQHPQTSIPRDLSQQSSTKARPCTSR